MKVKNENSGLSSVVADIGATNIRFARLTARGDPGPIVKFAASKFPDLKAALAHFLELAQVLPNLSSEDTVPIGDEIGSRSIKAPMPPSS